MAGGEGVVEERPGGAVLRVKNDTGEGSMAFCQVGEEAIISSAVTPSGRMVKEARS